MRSRIVSVFSEALAQSKIPALDVAARYGELGNALLPLINPQTTAKYGLEITSFVVENVSVPPEVEQAIDKRSSMAAVGNLNDYVKFQMAQGLEKGNGGPGGMAAEMAVGMAMAQQMMNQSGGIMGPQTTPAVAGAGRDRRPGAAIADARASRAAARRCRIRRDVQPPEGRSEGQADRHAMARHACRGRSVPAFVILPESEARSQVTANRCDFRALRAVLALGIGLLCAGPLAAQDPRASLVQETARAWLADTDLGNAAQSWKNAGKQFRNAITVERWAESLKARCGRRWGRFRNAQRLARNSARTFPARLTANTRSSLFRTTFAKKTIRAKP